MVKVVASEKVSVILSESSSADVTVSPISEHKSSRDPGAGNVTLRPSRVDCRIGQRSQNRAVEVQLDVVPYECHLSDLIADQGIERREVRHVLMLSPRSAATDTTGIESRHLTPHPRQDRAGEN
jgi:hypothetical protein